MRIMTNSTTHTRVVCAAVLACGLALAGVWTNTVGYSVSLVPAGGESIVGTPSADAFRLGRLCMGVLLIVFARRFPKVQRAAVVVAALVLSMGTGALVIAYHQTLLDPSMLALLGIFFAIACYSLMVWVFYRQFALRLPTVYAVWGIAASLVLEVWLSAFVCLHLSSAAQIAVAFFAPFAIAALYFAAFALDVQTPESKPYPRISERGEKLSLIAQVVLITVALVFIQALSEAGVWGEVRGAYMGMDEFSPASLGIISAIVLVLTCAVFYLPRHRLSLSLRCIVGFGVILLGLQTLALVSGSDVGSRLSVAIAGIESFSHLVRWLMVIECVRLVSTPSYRIGGIAHVASALVGLAWIHFLSEAAIDNSALAMAAVYLLFMSVVVILIRGHYSAGSRLWAGEGDGEGASIKHFADEYVLSAREAEIFELLLDGLKYADIEQRCSLSSGTVKTHVSNIYKKLDVHSRREMKELYEQYQANQGPQN